MKWESIAKDLSSLCMLLSHDDDTRIVNRECGTVEVQVYSQHPDHSANVIQNYTKPGRADSKSQKAFGSGRHRTITSSVRRQRKMAQKRHENWPHRRWLGLAMAWLKRKRGAATVTPLGGEIEALLGPGHRTDSLLFAPLLGREPIQTVYMSLKTN